MLEYSQYFMLYCIIQFNNICAGKLDPNKNQGETPTIRFLHWWNNFEKTFR